MLVLEKSKSPALSALVVAVSFIPWIGPGQILATKLGHFRRVRVMVGADLIRALIYGLLLISMPVPLLLGLVFIASIATPPFEAARSSLTIESSPEDVYGSAIALMDMTDQAAIVVGYLVGGAAVGIGGARVALVIDVVSFLISALALSRVREATVEREASGAASQLRKAFATIWSLEVVRRGILLLLVVALPATAVEATAAVYARQVLHSGADIAGALAAAVPCGMLVTIPLLPRSGTARRLLRVSAAVAMVGGLLGGGAFGFAHLPGALIGYAAAGVMGAATTPAQIAFQPRIPRDQRPGIFSLLQGSLMGAQGIGAAIGGVVATALNAREGGIIWMGIVVVLAGVSWLLPLRVPEATGGTESEASDDGATPRGTAASGEDPEENDLPGEVGGAAAAGS